MAGSKDIKDPQAVYTHLYSDGVGYGSGPVGQLYKWVKEKLNPGNLIDLCCGHGMFGNYEKDREYTGIDFASTAVERNRKKWPHKRFEVCDLSKKNSADFGKFDNVVMCDALEHFHAEDLPNTFGNIKACAKPGAKIFFSISTRPSSGWEYEGVVYDLHLTVWPAAQWLETIEVESFKVLDYEEAGACLLVECEYHISEES